MSQLLIGAGACTREYLSAIDQTRPSLTEAMLTEFFDDIEQHTRL
ncbi:hypothetical protein [uncultured Mycobacterium sp.]